MSALSRAPAESMCPDCGEEVTGLALKCGSGSSGRSGKSGCEKYVHLRCSQLPSYCLVRFDVSRASYLCKACVRLDGGDQYEESLRKIEDLLRHPDPNPTSPSTDMENSGGTPSLVTQIADARNSSGNLIGERSNGTSTQTPRPTGREEQMRPEVCPEYIKKKCRFGKSGRVGGSCQFSHPRLCLRFLKRGNTPEGCTRGGECRFHHPKICWKFAKRRGCTKSDCKFYHNTLKVKPNRGSSGEGGSGRNSRQGPSIPQERRFPSAREERPAPMRNRTNEAPETDMDHRFLEAQNQMQVQINQLQQLMQMFLGKGKAPARDQTVLCQCGQRSF